VELHIKCLDKTTQPMVPAAVFGSETGECPAVKEWQIFVGVGWRVLIPSVK